MLLFGNVVSQHPTAALIPQDNTTAASDVSGTNTRNLKEQRRINTERIRSAL